MPLLPGQSRNAISSNIRELTNNGTRPRSHAQIVAIALSNARKTSNALKPKFNLRPKIPASAGLKKLGLPSLRLR